MTTIDQLIEESQHIKPLRYDSPRVAIWKVRVETHVKDGYPDIYLPILQEASWPSRIAAGEEDCQYLHQESIDKITEFLWTLKESCPASEEEDESKEVKQQKEEANMDKIADKVIELLKDTKDFEPEAGYIAGQLSQFDRGDVIRTVYYLLDVGQLKKKVVKGEDHFRLGSQAIDRFEASKYKKEAVPFYHISGTGHIIVHKSSVGTINQHNASNLEQLERLLEVITTSDIDPDVKRDAVINAETIKGQLLLPNPMVEMMKLAWNAVARAADLSGAQELALKVKELLGI